MGTANETREELHAKFQKEWVAILSKVFPDPVIPERYEWKSTEDILTILNIIGKKNKNHLFFPTGGGLDLTGADKAKYEFGCIELKFDEIRAIVKPGHLEFYKIDNTLSCSYFRLILADLAPSGCYEDLSCKREELLDIEGKYASRSYWDQGEYHGETLPESARLVIREWGKCMLIFGKGSPYNTEKFGKIDAYFKEMTNMETDKLNSFLIKLSAAANKAGRD